MSEEMGAVPEQEREQRERLVKTARMYAMCEKAGFSEPLLPATLALAAFEDITLEEANAFVKTNRPGLEDLSWAFAHSNSAEEFEEKLRERLESSGREPGNTRG